MLNETYRLVQKLGSGGGGSVYLAIHERTCRLWAVKRIAENELRIGEGEAAFWMGLAHPGLPELADLFREGEYWYLVIEYIPGKTLETIRREEGGQSPARVADWMRQLCETLNYLHSRTPPVIHGDIKPSNLICESGGRLILTDLGSSRKTGSLNPVVHGTRFYAAPEQFHGQAEVCSDIYSMGKTMEYMLEETGAGGRGRQKTGARGPKRPGNKGYGRKRGRKDINRILDKCTEPDPQKRYRSAQEVEDALLRSGKKAGQKWLAVLAGVCSMAAAAVTAVERSQTKIQSEQYQIYCQSSDISEIKSAIFLDPYRDEAYQKLIEQILKDYRMTAEEETELREILQENEKYLRQEPKAYGEVAYQVGIAYWFYDEEQDNKKRGAAWFEKAEKTKCLTEEQQEKCQAFTKLGKAYRFLDQKAALEAGGFSYLELWSTCRELSVREKRRGVLELQIWRELLGFVNTCMSGFYREGVPREEIEDLLSRVEAETGSRTEREESLKETQEIKRQVFLAKKGLEAVYRETGKEENR